MREGSPQATISLARQPTTQTQPKSRVVNQSQFDATPTSTLAVTWTSQFRLLLASLLNPDIVPHSMDQLACHVEGCWAALFSVTRLFFWDKQSKKQSAAGARPVRMVPEHCSLGQARATFPSCDSGRAPAWPSQSQQCPAQHHGFQVGLLCQEKYSRVPPTNFTCVVVSSRTN